MAYCKHCGKEIDDKAVVCIYCGCATNDTEVSSGNVQHSKSSDNNSNMMSVVGLVISCVSLIVALFGTVAIGGIIVSTIGLVKSKQKNGAGKGMAIAGIIVGGLSLIYTAIALCRLEVALSF